VSADAADSEDPHASSAACADRERTAARRRRAGWRPAAIPGRSLQEGCGDAEEIARLQSPVRRKSAGRAWEAQAWRKSLDEGKTSDANARSGIREVSRFLRVVSA
jgi:hypothetical protein